MTDQPLGIEDAEPASNQPARRERWHQRSTVRALKRQAENGDREFTRKWDARENDETRLPESEAIHLGGLVLVEAFTPSTVSALFKALKEWPGDRDVRKEEWLQELAASRSGHRRGWTNLGVVRPRGTFTMGSGYHDRELPPGVDAWLHVSYVTPALAMVVATFTLAENAGDLSDILRCDYRTYHFDTRLRVHGRLGDLRARLPWACPTRYGIGSRVSHAADQKRRACHALIRMHEDSCSRWFFARFPGRFAAARPEEQPRIRMLFTTEEVPYAERLPWLRPVGLDFALPLWRSTDLPGWWLSGERWPDRDGRHVMTLAARRADAADPPPRARTETLTGFSHSGSEVSRRPSLLD